MTATQNPEDVHGAQVFQKFPLTITTGKGSTVWDDKGKSYLDFMTGYGAALVGHSNPRVVAAVKAQADTLITCHGSFYNETRARLLERLAELAPRGLGMALLTNSGTETIEAAIKVARRATGRRKVVSMKGGFHGKTFGSLSATWNKKYRDPFAPLLDGFEFADYGDSESLERLVGEDTAAVIAEPIQGESGVIIPPDDFLVRAREACSRRGALLILDEIQTGLGRTGRMWASEHWGVIPDLMAVSKSLGGGVPIGALLGTPEAMASLKKGEHTSTFAGNPLACAAASATLDFITDEDLPSKARLRGEQMEGRLASIASGHKIEREARGMGLMRALELRVDVRGVLMRSIADGAIFAYSGRDIVRFLPPLVMEEAEVSRGMEILEAAITQEESVRLSGSATAS